MLVSGPNLSSGMAEWVLSEKAARDLADIYVYTYGEFGLRQAETYTSELTAKLSLLAQQAGLGRRIEDIPGNCCRFVHRSHLVIYQIGADIFVVRILHRRMYPARHLVEGE